MLWTELDILKMMVLYGSGDSERYFVEGNIPCLKACLKCSLNRSKSFRTMSQAMRRAGHSGKENNDLRLNSIINFKLIKLAIKFLLNKEGG